MKINYLLLVLSFTALITRSNAQQDQEIQYLFSAKDLKVSGFMAPIVEFSTVDNNFAVSVGGEAAILFNQKFYTGFYGMGLTTVHDFPDIYGSATDTIPDFPGYQLGFGHGGFLLGYVNNYNKLVHFGLSSKIGFGGINLMDKDFKGIEENKAEDFVVVFTPQAEIEVNMARWFKVNLGVGYRFVTGISNDTYFNQSHEQVRYYKPSMFNSPQITLSFIFGYFGQKMEKS